MLSLVLLFPQKGLYKGYKGSWGRLPPLPLKMWVKGIPLDFIVNNKNSNKNLILDEFTENMMLLIPSYRQVQTIGFLTRGWDIYISQYGFLWYNMKPFDYEVLRDIALLEVCDVLIVIKVDASTSSLVVVNLAHLGSILCNIHALYYFI